jgi:phosphatidylglycerol:prolipoprotein diacylglycerol transferase
MEGFISASGLSFILWDARPEIFPDGPVPVRWYGLLFALGFFLGQIIISRIFRAEGKPEKDVDALTYYMIIATVLGARLGHCLFYEGDVYLRDPLRILKIWEGGLASHGAAVGIILAMFLYARSRPDQSWLWILDRVVIVVALGGACIRMGNLMNSEILGKPSGLPWAMVFVQPFETALMKSEGTRIAGMEMEKAGPDTLIDGRIYQPIDLSLRFFRDRLEGSSERAFVESTLPAVIEVSNGTENPEEKIRLEPLPRVLYSGYNSRGEKELRIRLYGVPRHPAMVYESLSCLLLFLFLYAYWKRRVGRVPEGRIFALFCVILFSLRFAYEFLKENQVAFESEMSLNLGQWLSIPLVVAGLALLLFGPPARSLKTGNPSPAKPG